MDPLTVIGIAGTLGLSGLAYSMIETKKFYAQVRETQNLDSGAMLRALRWWVAGGVWCGFFVSIAIVLIVEGSPQSNLSLIGAIALILGIPIFCGAILFISFLLSVVQIRAMYPMTEQKQSEVKPDQKHK